LGVQDALGAHQRFTGQLVGDAVRGAGRHLPRDGNESAKPLLAETEPVQSHWRPSL
jgi:hypothetical protein